jgi:hypothetical protein
MRDQNYFWKVLSDSESGKKTELLMLTNSSNLNKQPKNSNLLFIIIVAMRWSLDGELPKEYRVLGTTS